MSQLVFPLLSTFCQTVSASLLSEFMLKTLSGFILNMKELCIFCATYIFDAVGFSWIQTYKKNYKLHKLTC